MLNDFQGAAVLTDSSFLDDDWLTIQIEMTIVDAKRAVSIQLTAPSDTNPTSIELLTDNDIKEAVGPKARSGIEPAQPTQAFSRQSKELISDFLCKVLKLCVCYLMAAADL